MASRGALVVWLRSLSSVLAPISTVELILGDDVSAIALRRWNGDGGMVKIKGRKGHGMGGIYGDWKSFSRALGHCTVFIVSSECMQI